MFKRVGIGQVDPAQNGTWVNVLQALSLRTENDVYTQCDFRVNDRIVFFPVICQLDSELFLDFGRATGGIIWHSWSMLCLVSAK